MWFLLLYLFTAFLVLFLGIADIDFRPRLHMHRDSKLNVMRQAPHTRSMDGVVPLGAGPRRVRTSIDPGTVGLVCLVLPAVVLIMHASLARPLRFPALAPQHMSGAGTCIRPVPIISRSRFSPRFHGHGIYTVVFGARSSMGEPS